MYKSILAISEGGPDAAMSFGLAARIAAMFQGTVDAVHFSEDRPDDVNIAAAALPFLKGVSDLRLRARARDTELAFRELLAPIAGATFTGGADVTRERLVAIGRYADLVLLGRPGTDEENIDPATVRAAIFDCARPVVVAPPAPMAGPIASVVVAWNGSAQAARAVGSAMPFLEKARTVTIVVADTSPAASLGEIGTPLLLRNLRRRGIDATMATLALGAVSGRARGRALIGYVKEKRADLLVMGAYGHGPLSNFLGLGGVTAKVITSCPVPLLLAH